MAQSDDLNSSRGTTLEPLRQAETLSQKTTEVLRDRIVAGDFRMGERLIESSLASQLQISRGPVREALKQLRTEGLVREEPRRGYFVVELTDEDIGEIYDLRAAIEARAIRLIIANRDIAALDQLRGIVQRLRQAAEEGNQILFTQLDLSFHERLCLLSGNGRLYHVFQEFATVLSMLFRIALDKMHLELEFLAREVEILFDAIESLNVRRAEEECDRFIELAKERLLAGLGSSSSIGSGY